MDFAQLEIATSKRIEMEPEQIASVARMRTWQEALCTQRHEKGPQQ